MKRIRGSWEYERLNSDASTPLGCEKQIERFHQFFGIDPQKCLIHRMLTPTQIPQIDARPSPRS